MNDTLLTAEQQVAQKMAVTPDGKHALCLDRKMSHYGWILYKHPDGQWVSLRKALPAEINGAIAKLESMDDSPRKE